MSFPKPLNMKAFIENKPNTNATIQRINIVNKYLLVKHNEIRERQDMNAESLDNYLSQFFIVLKKQNGTDYKAASINCFNAEDSLLKGHFSFANEQKKHFLKHMIF